MDEIKKFDLSNRLFYLILVTAVGLVGFLGMGIYAFMTVSDQASNTISISGEGKAYAKPDIATIVLGVKTEEKKSDDAVNKNNEKMTVIIKAIKDLGIDAKDIQTTTYNLQPVYNYTDNAGRVLTGYSLDQQITVKVRNFDKISSVLDKAAINGANNIGSLQISVENPEAVKAEARAKAIEQAKQKAREMTKTSGIKLGKLMDVSEGSYYSPSDTRYENSLMKVGMGAAPAPVADIQVGQDEFSISVTLTYKVK